MQEWLGGLCKIVYGLALGGARCCQYWSQVLLEPGATLLLRVLLCLRIGASQGLPGLSIGARCDPIVGVVSSYPQLRHLPDVKDMK